MVRMTTEKKRRMLVQAKAIALLARENGWRLQDWSKIGYDLSDHKCYKIK